MAAQKLVKMVGPMGWCALSDDYRGLIRRCILCEGKELTISVDWGGEIYSLTLHRTGLDHYEGNWSRRAGLTVDGGMASATLYTSSRGNLLFGEWVEEVTRYRWWAELSTVAHFPDEGKGRVR